MKIAVIIERFNVSLGGAETSVRQLVEELRRVGNEVDLLAASGNVKEKLEGVYVLCNESVGKRIDLKVFEKAVKEHLAANEYDIVHSVLPLDFADVYQPRGGSYAEAIKQNAASYSNKLLAKFKILTSGLNKKRAEFLRAEKKLCGKDCTVQVASLSKYVKDQFISHYGLDEERISVVENGVKVDEFSGCDQADKLAKRLSSNGWLDKLGDHTVFLFAAHNFRLKGLKQLIKAMAIVCKKDIPNKPVLLVAGRGDKAKYGKLAKKMDVAERIDFVGQVSDVRGGLAMSNVAVLPSFYDPASRFILEALSTKTPAITTRFNGVCDLMVNGRHGRVVDTPEDIDGLADAIEYYCNAVNIKATQQAIEDDGIVEKVSIRRHVKGLMELYARVLSSR